MRISTTSCLCPFLVCLCFIQRCYGASHHVPAKVPSKNQTKLANGETEVHHRPKRGWIWNQFFVLEEHMGPEAQYVGKVGFFIELPATVKKKRSLDPSEVAFQQLTWHIFFPLLLFIKKWVTAGASCSVEVDCNVGTVTRFYYLLMWKSRSHL